MQRFQITHDAQIVIQAGPLLYIDTPAHYQADSGRAAPNLAGLVIVLGGAECVIDAQGNQRAHGLTTARRAECLAAIANLAQIIANRETREAAARAAAQAEAEASMTIEQKRELEYMKRGATDRALVVALWEQIVEGRSEAAQAIQAVRTQIKTEFPKA